MGKQRYEQEIEELLARLEGRLPQQPPRRPRVRRLWRWWRPVLGALWGDLSPGQLMLLSMVLLVLALLLRVALPGSGHLFALAGLLLFGLAYVLSLARGRQAPRLEKRWRGRVVDLPAAPPPFSLWWQRLRRRWWKRR